MSRIAVNVQQGNVRINRHIYGNFSEHLGRCIYDGFWVGEGSPVPNTRGLRNDIIEALKKIKMPNLRWPGGCFADEYHWKDGIGPRSQRPKMINTHWGGVTEDNSFGSHEFLDLCARIGCEPYICGNVGSGTVQELSQWVEYMNFDGQSPMADLRKKNGREKPFNVRLWGIGNENWGCGGMMTPEYYADLFRRYAVYARNYGDTPLFKIACGPNSDNYHWTEVMMQKTYMKGNPRNSLHGLSLHYYTVPGDRPDRGSATVFNEKEWFVTMKKAYFMDELVQKHGAIMDQYDPEKYVALVVDEWGTWYDVEPGTNPGFLYQQNTLRDALVAGIHLNIFNNYAERVRIANIAQTINVLQSVILTEGAKMVLTPTYHVFDMYKVHQDAVKLPVYVECDNYTMSNISIPALSASASVDHEDCIHVSLCNIDPNTEQKVRLELRGASPSKVTGQIISSANMQDYNSFDQGDKVGIKEFKDMAISGSTITLRLPAKSVVTLEAV
ncbi:alpha-N-arabinofuranosidase [Spirochaetia bacterium]|nr:alpha-N-arabinofuranosidase [Spirochaetia bacterium]